MENGNTLHELIEKYDFSELNQEQQQFVLLEITKEEYLEYRNTIALTSNYFKNEPIMMAEDLVVPKVEKESALLRIVNYKLPIYKIAAILVVVLSIDHLVPMQIGLDTQIVETQNEFIIHSDTFLTYNRYSSKNSIKYDTWLSRVYN